MNPYIGLFFDLIMLIALGVTIHRAWKLSQQFELLQADRKAFDALISALNLASSRAEAAIGGLKAAANESGDILQDRINKARSLSDELDIMVQAGDNLADRLNKLAENSRRAAGNAALPLTAQRPGEMKMPPAKQMPEKAPPTQKEMQPRTRAEKELLDALKAKQKS